ncbi:MAG: TlpA family protein disulfide reductase, partial [Spirochaetaceae bacterium]|nr:TlpA family protein disulfide reductase [Spirochaetaceae bacterium]
GTPLSTTELKGKVIVIEFWATWCRTCISEIPLMKKIYEEYKDRGVEFIGISLDEYPDTVIQYCIENNIDWPQYCEENKIWDTDISRSWGIKAIPTVFLIGKDGQIISREARGQLEKLIPLALADK